MARLGRLLRALPLLLASPLLLLGAILGLLLTDLACLFLRRRLPQNTRPNAEGASVVIPTWNGRDLLEKNLPFVEAALARNPANEIIVVDNGSGDGTAAFLNDRFPGVRVLQLPRNLGFGGGANAGVRAARNDVVVLLNNDMRVEADFLEPLLAGFRDDEGVFAVSCQILFPESKVRQETGLTQGWWEDGMLRVRHRIDRRVAARFPCFYGGGGSCAFDRPKLLELGGFDPLFEPFYLEDTDLGYLAWKRGWKVYYEPRSVVHHEHRATIGRRFRPEQIAAVLSKNFLLFCWKNIHEWRRLLAHFGFLYAGALVSLVLGDVPGRANLAALWGAVRQLPQALRSRARARRLALLSDTEAFCRPLGGYFHDRFGAHPPSPEALRVLFVSPYPICPPVHGGGVFMFQAIRELARLAEVHVLALLDRESQIEDHRELSGFCASTDFLVLAPGARRAASIVPRAAAEFSHPDLEWAIHRQIFEKRIDVLQLEYMPLGQYAGRYRRLASMLFEHDIYFQSVQRSIPFLPASQRPKACFEYLRALRYELRLLEACDGVQVCSAENKACLLSYSPRLRGRVEAGLRAGIDAAGYRFESNARRERTMLFLGSFRHLPNQVALEWFSREVLPLILTRRPEARLVIAGSDPPPRHAFGGLPPSTVILGLVPDVRPLLESCAVLVSPIRNGSGVRVKLLEAFASGIPVVSTRLGAEGLARVDAEFCRLADQPGDFADRVLEIFDHPAQAAEMAARARAEVLENWNMPAVMRKLERSYRVALARKRAANGKASISRASSSSAG
ncbi:MAG: glycosyltransferase [Acidobacteria bacterium]|nr:glycosyltransferase [Acidobacteriota bacterium]